MAENSAIEWTDHTWSPWEGCTKVSPACDHCYAERMNRWLKGGENWGPGAPRRIYSDDHWRKPLRWNDAARRAGKPVKVFPSVCDPFDNEAPDGMRDRFWSLIEATPWVTWLLLTKRVGNVAHQVWPRWMQAGFPANVRIGATMANQPELDRDARKLLALPAHGHFISYEPALGPIDVTPWLRPYCDAGSRPHPDGGGTTCPRCEGAGGCAGLSWVIAGGESGRQARPSHLSWYRSLRDQCAAAGVPFLFKQWGEWIPAGQPMPNGALHKNIRQFGYDEEGRHRLHRIGKGVTGRLLDGVEHNGFPEAR